MKATMIPREAGQRSMAGWGTLLLKGVAAVLAVCCLIVLLMVTGENSLGKPTRATAAATDQVSGVVPGVVVVKAKAGSVVLGELLRGVTNALAQANVRGIESLLPRASALKRGSRDPLRTLLERVYLVRINPGDDPRRTAALIASHPDIEYAEPKYLHRLEAFPDDPALANQNAPFSRLQLFDAWSITTGSRDVILAVVDGGTFWPHEDLTANLWINALEDLNGNGQFDPGDEDGVDQDGNGFVDDVIGWNFADGSNDPIGLPSTPQSHGHGTATASHFGAVTNNGIGMAGTAWNAALLPVCASTPAGDNLIAYGYEGIIYAAMQGASVINCSWGRLGGFSAFEQDVIAAVTSLGSLVVAAAGNTSTDVDLQPHYPSSYQHVLSVGATHSDNDQKASFSNYGANVSVLAPGVNIWSAMPNGLYGLAGSGTSFASSLVAGIAGLLCSQHPSWTPEQVAAQIRATADPIDGNNPTLAGKLGRGRVNASRAVTESHPALEIVGVDVRSTTGSTILLVGDTAVVSVRVRNVLFTGVGSTLFSLSTGDPVLEVLGGLASGPPLDPGAEVVLPSFTFAVGPTSLSKAVALRLEWTLSGEPPAARSILVNVFPSVPTWVQQESPTNIPLFSVKGVSRDVAWAAGGNQVGTSPVVLRTTDGGETWEIVTGTLNGVDLYCITAIDANRAWVGSGDGRIFATGDGGMSWIEQAYPDPQSGFINGVWFADAANGLAQGDPPPGSTRFVLLHTSDGGTSWSQVPNAPIGSAGEYGWNNSFLWTDMLHGWFGTNNNKIWRTTDGGTTWSFAASGSTSSVGIAFTDNLVGFAAHGNGTVAKSTDGGASWVNGSIGAGVGLVAAATPPSETSVWVSSAATPFQSEDLGQSWKARSTYPLAGDITHLSFATTDRGWATTSGGEILRYDPRVPTSVTNPKGETTPVSFRLEHNYPNPFNPTTTIGFALPRQSHIRLIVVDLLGRTVRMLVDEERAAGTYREEFNASGLASGVYFYSLSAQPSAGGPAHVMTRPMVLTR